jgi:hypothetical protein
MSSDVLSSEARAAADCPLPDQKFGAMVMLKTDVDIGLVVQTARLARNINYVARTQL